MRRSTSKSFHRSSLAESTIFNNLVASGVGLSGTVGYDFRHLVLPQQEGFSGSMTLTRMVFRHWDFVRCPGCALAPQIRLMNRRLTRSRGCPSGKSARMGTCTVTLTSPCQPYLRGLRSLHAGQHRCIHDRSNVLVTRSNNTREMLFEKRVTALFSHLMIFSVIGASSNRLSIRTRRQHHHQ